MSARAGSPRARLSGLAALAIALLLGAWLFSTLPFQAPDEASHYLRALSITNGQLLGRKTLYTEPSPITSTQRRWTSGNTRAVDVPGHLSPPNVTCAADNQPDTTPAGCVEQSYTGNYPPLPYLLPAAALAVSHSADGALWLGRVASALPCLALIVLAFVFAISGGLWPLFGLLVALTPMSLFVGSLINPNGLQIAANLAFAVGLLRVVRDPRTVSRAEIAAVAISGAVVVLAWQLGPLFAVCDLALAGALLDRRRAGELLDRRGLIPVVAVAISGSLLLYAVWAAVSGLANGGVSFDQLRSHVTAALHQFEPILHQSVGSFGSVSIPVPHGLYLAWLVIALALGAAAVAVSPWRLRVVAVATPLLAMLVPLVFFALIYVDTGWQLQGRYVLPLIALPPLLWGELVGRARAAVARFWLLPVAGIAATAVLQCWAWWTNARASASATHAFWFLANPVWNPPVGWPVLTAAALVGGLLLIAVAALGGRLELGSDAATDW